MEALNTAIYLYNRIPHSKSNFKSPYEARFNKKPRLDNIKIFGLITYLKNHNIKKLDVRFKPIILVGFGSVIILFGLYNFKIERIFYSRDITILEGI